MIQINQKYEAFEENLLLDRRMAVMRMRDARNATMDTSKYIRYTPEQIEALERVYNECPKPNSIRRQQLLREYPVLANIEPRQIKVWFQNRRCREKQRKETTRLQSVNASLSAMNKIIMEENERLTRRGSQLALENQYLRQQMQQTSMDPDKKCTSRKYNSEQVAIVAADRSPDSEVTGGLPQQVAVMHLHPRDSSPAGLLAIAEEILSEFLAKATGTAVDWIQMPGMKPGPDNIGTAAILHGGAGVAARAWGLVGLEPAKVSAILKDKPAWLQDCRRLDIMGAFSTPNRGTVELIYTQMYAPTTLAPARDFWTLRYTTFLDDENLVVCEGSLNSSKGGPNLKSTADFSRAEMLPSGFLIRPYEGGVCSIHIVDHMDLESWKVLEIIRPLYESSAVVAQKMTLRALRYLRRISQEASGELILRGQQPAAVRALGYRIARGFNDAINGFTDDGWSAFASDGIDDVSVAINTSPSLKHLGGQFASDKLCSISEGILCAKASMLLQNVPPATLIQFLRQHRSEWTDCSLAPDDASMLRTHNYGLSISRGGAVCMGQIPFHSSQAAEEEEFLEMIKLEEKFPTPGGGASCDTVLLQLCSGINDNALGACAQLVFAPVDAAVSDDAPLLPSGFRVIPLDSRLDGYDLSRTLDLASTLEGSDTSTLCDTGGSSCPLRSVLTMAFQFVFEAHNCDEVAASARQYIRNVMVSVQGIAMALAPRQGLQSGPSAGTLVLAHQILRSYRASFGLDLSEVDAESTDALLNVFWHYKDAIICCTWKTIPEFVFANQAGLAMLETTWNDLNNIHWEKTFDENARKSAYTDFTQIIQQGFAYLPGGMRLSSLGRTTAYERAVAWKVLDDDETTQCIAFLFVNWSFLA